MQLFSGNYFNHNFRVMTAPLTGWDFMVDIVQKLSEFYAAKAPDALSRLPNPLSIKREHHGTNFHFLVGLYLEAGDILSRGDTLVTSFNFTRDDTVPLLAAIRLISRRLVIDLEIAALSRTLPEAMRKVATYYEQKIVASEEALDLLAPEARKERKKFEAYLAARNYDALLDYFPHSASLIYDEGATDVPAKQGNLGSLERRRMAVALGAEINWAEQNGIPLFAHLGAPDFVHEGGQKASALRHDISRNAEVLEAVRKVADDLEGIFDPPRAQIIRFPSARVSSL
ncbi:MAG: hypothetical protein SFW62_08735 [Alphaproteobacteria bacterium]|nr:hypothetical protein [Alphaproteobacteria bacterium]